MHAVNFLLHKMPTPSRNSRDDRMRTWREVGAATGMSTSTARRVGETAILKLYLAIRATLERGAQLPPRRNQ